MTTNPQPNSDTVYTSPSQVFPNIGQELYLEEESADFHFVFDPNDGPCIRVPAHKLLLSKGSKVFRTMFNGSWNENNEVEIVDASMDAFKEFLQFFYLVTVKLTLDNVTEVMYLGNKYNVKECLEICSKFLRNTIDEHNILWGYKLAITYDQKNLKSFCETIIGLKTKEVLASDDFLQCDFEVLSHIVKLGSLACLESELFAACMHRIEVVGKKNDSAMAAAKTDTKKLFKSFRFGSMSFEELAVLSCSYPDIFSLDEYREIVHLIGLIGFHPMIFNENRQKRIDSNSYCEKEKVSCSRLISKFCSSREYYIKSIETTMFSTTKSVLLKKFVCSKLCERGQIKFIKNNLPMKFTIHEILDSKESSDAVAIYSGMTDFQPDERTVISLDRPVFIRNGLKYKIQLEQSPPDGCWSAAILKPKVQVQPDFVVQFYNDVPEDDIVSRGLILDLGFIRI